MLTDSDLAELRAINSLPFAAPIMPGYTLRGTYFTRDIGPYRESDRRRRALRRLLRLEARLRLTPQ